MQGRLLILDFDGTLCLGDGPVTAFARQVERAASARRATLTAPLERFLAGEPGTEFEGCADGYTAVGLWARTQGLEQQAISAAFLLSRAEVDAGDVEVVAAEGAVDRLAAMSDWHRVLVTNAPLGSTLTLTARLGLTHVLDAIIGDAAKPGGLESLLVPGARLGAERFSRIVSIGDIWVNDLAPVHAIGGETGLIERHPQPQATPTRRAGDVVQLLDQI